MEMHGLVPHILFPHSRDWKYLDCKATSCLFNMIDGCIAPSRAEIGEDGRCVGFSPRVPIKKEERTGD